MMDRVTNVVVNNQNKGTRGISRVCNFQPGLMSNFYVFRLPFCRRNAEKWLVLETDGRQSRCNLLMTEMQGWEGKGQQG